MKDKIVQVDMGKLRTLMNPPIFQGSLKENNYFEGWYFKNVSKDMSSVLSFIPGISLSKNEHAFIQVLDGITGWTHYFEFSVKDFKPLKERFMVNIGPNEFSTSGLKVDLEENDLKINGEVRFSNLSPFPKGILSPE